MKMRNVTALCSPEWYGRQFD